MIKKKVLKRVKTEKVIGNKFSREELEEHKKHNIWTPENDDMVISNESPLTWTEFARRLKAIDKNIFIHYWDKKPSPEAPFGHAIRYRDLSVPPNYYMPICGVGKAGEVMIPAQSRFNHYKNKDTDKYETRIDTMGWVAAEEQVINFLVSRGKNNGS